MIVRIAFALITLVMIERFVELRLAAKYAVMLRNAGAHEIDADHFYWFFIVHGGFFISLCLEIWYGKASLQSIWPPALLVFAGAQALRLWSILTLGQNWNVRIFVQPGASPVTTGPYRYLRHPNYLAVTLEILTLPLVFYAVGTAILFSLLNFLLLRRRIMLEEAAWMRETDYARIMREHKRWLFWGRIS